MRGDLMPDLFQFNSEMQQYFDTLPAIVQETIKQSNSKVGSLEDLKACAENMMKKGLDWPELCFGRKCIMSKDIKQQIIQELDKRIRLLEEH